MSSLVVKNHRPWQFAVAIVILSMFLASFTWLLLDKGHWALIYEQIGDNQEWKNLWEVNQSLQEERLALQERVLMLERTTSVDKQTAAILQDEIKSLQESLYKMKGELEFYEGIMDATRGAKGLNIHGIYIEPLAQHRTYRLKLVLTHVAKASIEATGTMKITIVGKVDESEQDLKIEDVAIGENIDLSYKLRSFKRLEIKLALPDNFTADRVAIELQPKTRNQAIIKEVFDWTAPAS
ncbi:MAG: hypothetical protein GKR93_15290 [Gammaproteobacteria bacterium]|nr:hypothetical protein [Gammaproteobacteria bacterium]